MDVKKLKENIWRELEEVAKDVSPLCSMFVALS